MLPIVSSTVAPPQPLGKLVEDLSFPITNVLSPQGTPTQLVGSGTSSSSSNISSSSSSASTFTVNANSNSGRVTYDVKTNNRTGTAVINAIFDSEGLLSNSEELQKKIAGMDVSLRKIVGVVDELKKAKESSKNEDTQNIGPRIETLTTNIAGLQATLKDVAKETTSQAILAAVQEILTKLAVGDESIKNEIKNLRNALETSNAADLKSILEKIGHENAQKQKDLSDRIETLSVIANTINNSTQSSKSSNDTALKHLSDQINNLILNQKEVNLAGSKQFDDLSKQVTDFLKLLQKEKLGRDKDDGQKIIRELLKEQEQKEILSMIKEIHASMDKAKENKDELLKAINNQGTNVRKHIGNQTKMLVKQLNYIGEGIESLKEDQKELLEGQQRLLEDLTKLHSKLLLELPKIVPDLEKYLKEGFKEINTRLDNQSSDEKRKVKIKEYLKHGEIDGLVSAPTTMADSAVSHINNVSSSSSSADPATFINLTEITSSLERENSNFIKSLKLFLKASPKEVNKEATSLDTLATYLTSSEYFKSLDKENAEKYLSKIAQYKEIYSALIEAEKNVGKGKFEDVDKVAGKIISFVNKNPDFPEVLKQLELFNDFTKRIKPFFKDVKSKDGNGLGTIHASCDIETFVRSEEFEKLWKNRGKEPLIDKKALFFLSDNNKTLSIVRGSVKEGFEILTTETPYLAKVRDMEKDITAILDGKGGDLKNKKDLTKEGGEKFGRYTLVTPKDRSTYLESLKSFKGKNTETLAFKNHNGSDVFYRGVYSIVKPDSKEEPDSKELLNLTVNKPVTDNAKVSRIAPAPTHYNITVPDTCGLLSRNVHLNKHCGVESLGGGKFRLAPPGLKISEVEINNNGSVERASDTLLKNLQVLGIYDPKKERKITASLMLIPGVKGGSTPEITLDDVVKFSVDVAWKNPVASGGKGEAEDKVKQQEIKEKVIHKPNDPFRFNNNELEYSNRDVFHILKFLYGYYAACKGNVQNTKGLTSSGVSDRFTINKDGPLFLAVKTLFDNIGFDNDLAVHNFVFVENTNNKENILKLLSTVNEVLSGKKVAKDGVLKNVDDLPLPNPFVESAAAAMHMPALSAQEAKDKISASPAEKVRNEITAFKAIVRYNDLKEYLKKDPKLGEKKYPKEKASLEAALENTIDNLTAEERLGYLNKANFQSDKPNNMIAPASAAKVENKDRSNSASSIK